MGSDRNHPVLYLLHVRQHSLRAAEDLVLMCRQGDPYPRHVPVRKKHKTEVMKTVF